MFSRAQDLTVNLRVQMIGRAVVHHVQVRKCEQFRHAGAGVGHVKLACFFLRAGKRAVAERHHLHKPETPQRLDMRRADKPAADNPDINHGCPLPRSHQTHARIRG